MAELTNSEVKQVVTASEQFDIAVCNLMNEKAQCENTILKSYQQLKREEVAKVLSGIDIDKINYEKDGIRTNLLREAGINNLYQVCQMPSSKLCQIRGIGDAMASKIVKNATALRMKTEKTVHVKFETENPNAATTTLIRCLYIRLYGNEGFIKTESLYNETHQAVQKHLVSAKKRTNGLGWIFTSKENKAIANQSVDYLSNLMNREDVKLINGYRLTLEQIKAKSANDSMLDFHKNSAPYYALLENILGEELSDIDETNGLPEELLNSIEQYELRLEGLKANLRRYQRFGTQYILHQKKVLLGDEMGLGKTMQAIAAMVSLRNEGKKHFLVVCPLSVLVNWERELTSQSDLNVIAVYGEDRAMEMTQWSSDGGVAITTFETLNKLPIPQTVSLDMLTVDEAHYVKNPNAIRTQSLMAVAARAERILFMTGTPLENKVEEMSFLISCLQPEIAKQIEGMKQLAQAEQFREIIAPVYLRRVREDVLKELPELIEKEQWCIMNADELNAYKQALLSGNFMKVRQLSWDLADITKSTKANRLREIYEDAKAGNRRLLIFSFFKTVLEQVAAILGEDCVGIIDGSVPVAERQAMIDTLGKEDAGSALVCQIQAGGVGLNIQAASVVVFCEPQIKPSLETQAVARSYRMGQSQSVIVHHLLMQDSADERILEIKNQKSELFANFADESLIGDMDLKINENQVMKQIVEDELNRLGLSENTDEMTINKEGTLSETSNGSSSETSNLLDK